MRTRYLPAGALLLPAVLGAQQSRPDTLRRDTTVLAPTVVTVTRTPLELGRAPFAVGVSTREQIQRGRPGLALDEALAGIAGVQVDNRFNYALGERISVRGIGARAQFGVRGVRVLLDGIPMTLADGQTTLNNVDVGSLARAEVIRGPASALHGNAAGGVIQLESDATVGGDYGGELRATVGAHGLVRTQAAFSGRGDAAGYSATLSRLSFDGYRQWSRARNDHAALRFSREDSAGGIGVTLNHVDYDGRNPGGLSRTLLAANRDTAFANNLRDRTGERGKQTQIGMTWNRLMKHGGRVELSTHALEREIENPIPLRVVAIDRNAGGVRAAFTAAPRVGKHAARVSVGTELQVQRDDRRNFVSDSGRRGRDTLSQLERVVNTAVFGQSTLDLTSRLLLSAGVRYDRIRFEAEDRLVGAGNADDSGERLMDAVSPSLGVTLALSARTNVYGNVSTSFETPTTSELANRETGAGGFNPTLDPQRAQSVELGLNGRMRRLGIAGSYQLALFRMQVEGALIPFEVPSVPGRQYFRNAGSTINRGIESAVSLALPAGTFLRAAYTHLDARFDAYAVTTGTTTRVYDGNRVPGVAANRLDATLSWMPRWFTLDVDARASSAIPVNDANTDRSPAFTLWGLRLTARPLAIGGASLVPHVGVTNLFDAEYNTSVVVNAFGGRFFEPGPARSAYGGARISF